jgi:DNA-binding CsgD family transcriptional regulator
MTSTCNLLGLKKFRHDDDDLSATRFSIDGKECVVVDAASCESRTMKVFGFFCLDGRKYAVACGDEFSQEDALAVLSPRELEIARCISAGYQTKAIAQRLGISYYTVRVHLGRIYCKLGLHKQTELASWISAHYGRRLFDI